MLPKAAVVNNSSIRLGGQTVFSASYPFMTLLAVSVVCHVICTDLACRKPRPEIYS